MYTTKREEKNIHLTTTHLDEMISDIEAKNLSFGSDFDLN